MPREADLALLPKLSGFEGVTPWLYERLKRHEELDRLPNPVAELLRKAALEAAVVNLRVDEEAASVIALLQGAGIPVILLKGIARRTLGGHRYHTVRTTSDVDLLLPPDRLTAGFELLQGAGYQRAIQDREHSPRHHHLAALWNERRVAVELHSSLSRLADPALVWSRSMGSARTVEWQGLRVLVPSPTELAWATLVQAPSDALTLGFRLRELLDFAVLLDSTEALDWNEITERLGLGEAADGDCEQPVSRRVLAIWLATAQALSGALDVGGQVDLLSLLRWRLRILTTPRLRAGLADRLLGESARVSLGIPPWPRPDWVAPPAYRWRLTARAARTAFRAWRALSGWGRVARGGA